jgi:ABC-type Na+ efflux pump permease subunit
MKKVSQRYGLMKFLGGLYVLFSILLVIGGIIVGWWLYSQNFYPDYRRGLHLIGLIAPIVASILSAIPLFMMGSMANAIADIDRSSRQNEIAIDTTRSVAEKALTASETAAQRAERATLELQSGLQDTKAALRNMESNVTSAVSTSTTEARIAAREAVESASSRASGLVSSARERASDVVDDVRGATTASGVMGIGGQVENIAAEATEAIDDAAQNIANKAGEAHDIAGEVSDKILSSIRSRRPWQKDE